MEDKISILISTKNRKAILRQTLDVIFHHQNLPLEQFEVIVTNDGTEPLDELLTIFPYHNFRILPNKHKPGAAGGRNNGAENAQYTYLLFLDDDMLIPPNHLIRLLELHKKYKDSVISGDWIYEKTFVDKQQKETFGRYRLSNNSYKQEVEKENLIENGVYKVETLAAFDFFLRKILFELINGFNESFSYAGCEDAEFTYRLKQNNFLLLLDTNNLCIHNETDRFDLKSWLRRQSTGIRSAVVVCMLHPEGKEHPTWFTNTPLSKNDEGWVKRLKIKKWILSRWFVMKLLFAMVWLFEKLHFPDKVLFRLYNALWLGSTYKSFNETYKGLNKGTNK
jgi:GT2 family glycosyltransferase